MVMDGIHRLTAGRTTFIIAHRLSTVRRADLILVLRDGKIAESGSFDELMRRGGVFSTLYNTQFVDSPKPESRVATSVEPS
jgi:ABC-type multidrug transport system fused ATPase/permease subunit